MNHPTVFLVILAALQFPVFLTVKNFFDRNSQPLTKQQVIDHTMAALESNKANGKQYKFPERNVSAPSFELFHPYPELLALRTYDLNFSYRAQAIESKCQQKRINKDSTNSQPPPEPISQQISQKLSQQVSQKISEKIEDELIFLKSKAVTDFEKKLLSWLVAFCRNQPTDFLAQLDSPPYLHFTGTSYAKLFSSAFSKTVATEQLDLNNFLHIRERQSLNSYAHWYQSLSEQNQYLFLLGQPVLVQTATAHDAAVNHVSSTKPENSQKNKTRHASQELFAAVNHGWDGKSQQVTVFALSAFNDILIRELGYEIVAIPSAQDCDFMHANHCWRKHQGFGQSLEEKIGSQSIALFACVLFFLIATLIYFRRQEKLKRRNLQRKHAFLFRTISHEIRTPMTTIQLHLDGIRKEFDNLSESGQKNMLEILSSFTELKKVVEKSLEEIKGPSTTHYCNISKVVERLVERQFDGMVELEIEPSRREVQVSDFWISTICKNLVNNALRHGEGPVKVTVGSTEKNARLVVEDNGKASLKELKAFLKPFSKGEKSDGLGFGLSIVKIQTEELGGQLIVEASPTRFIVLLPFAKETK